MEREVGCEDEARLARELRDAVVAVETSWWTIAKTKEQAIRERTGMNISQYYIALSQLLDSPDFWREHPELVGRLKNLRDRRLDERAQLHD